MNTQLRTKILSSVIFFVIIASAVFTVPARADSGSPPPAPAAPGGSTHSAAQVPSGGANTGGGDQGHKVELSSQNAAYIAPAGDPIWCPSGVAVPVPGAGGCSANYANLYLLTNDVETGVIHPLVTNSNIWIQHGVDSSPNTMLLDGSVLPALSNVSLNFKGGWNGLGTGSVNPANPSTFTQGLRILSWNNNITLSDVQFSHVLTGTLEGIYIKTKGNISLTRVQSNNNPGFGAFLNNTSGAGTVSIVNSQFNGDAIPIDEALEVLSNNAITLTNVIANSGWSTILDNTTGSNKTVTIKSSSFDNTQAIGLIVRSKGAITLTNISASGNYNASTDGALIQNNTSITAAPVTLTGTNIFDSNLGTGLSVLSKGKITAGSIIAINNSGIGATFDNHSAATALPITLNGSSIFDGNGAEGLDISSQGTITANNLSADGNGSYGAWLDNHYSFVSPLNVTGTNVFNSNHTWGLYIDSNGAISLNNITANGNGSLIFHDGLFAENYSGSSIPQKITLTGANNFNNNTAGAVLQASGPVTVSNVTALGNTLSNGLMIQNHWLGNTMPQPAILLGHNLLSDNKLDNLDVETYGAITVNGLMASDSVSGFGAYLGFGVETPGNVTLNGLNTFNNNHFAGLAIDSKGTVLTNGLNAINNAGTGVQIDNTASSISSPVTLKGVNNFNFNSSGLSIGSNGTVVTNNLNVLDNNGSGVTIVNGISTVPAPVTLMGINNINYNNGGGLTIVSTGAVVANGLNAISNTGGGVTIVNGSATLSAPVTLKGLSTIKFSGGGGLTIVSTGAVITNGLNMLSNLGSGVTIVNGFIGIATPVTLNGLNTMNNNSSGLTIASTGAVIVNNLSAINNSGDGVNINNASSSFSSPVTLKGVSNVEFNSSNGLVITSKGTVLTNGLNAAYNTSNGVKIDNSGSSMSAPVTLNGVNNFNFNGSNGLNISTKGAVLAKSMNAISNTGDGADIDNSGSSTSAPVTLLGLSTFNLNGSWGLDLVSDGAVFTNGLNAIGNSSIGVFIDNGVSPSAPLTLKGVNTFKNNGAEGLNAFSRGVVITNNLTAMNNGSTGVFIDNSGSSFFNPVTLNGVNTLNNNASYGLFVVSKGEITTNNLTVGFNGSAGVYMDNSAGAGAAINVKGKNIIWGNGGDGMDLFSHGPVTVTNISSKLNSSDGLYVNSTGIVTVSCGNLVSNGAGHVTGYGWETGSLVTIIKLIGVTTAGNFSGDSHLNGATTVITVPHPCSLP